MIVFMDEKIYCTPSQMKDLEKASNEAGVDYRRLMDNAGGIAAAYIMDKMHENGIPGPAVILCGKGNNGGDGFVVAKDLSEIGMLVYCVLVDGDPVSELASVQLGELAAGGTVPIIMLSDNKESVFNILEDSSVIVDAVYGTGFHGELPPDIAEVLEFAGKCKAMKFAVDIPSGGNGSSGAAARQTIKADYTVTFGLEKIGTVLSPLKELCGVMYIADIGIPSACVKTMTRLIRPVTLENVKASVPIRPSDAHKGMFGRVLNIAGCESMPGAAALSTSSMLRSGAGLVKLASVKNVVRSLSASLYECTYMPLSASSDGSISGDNAAALASEAAKYDVTAIGCGLSVTEGTKKIVKSVINSSPKKLIIDADGLNCLSGCIDIIRNTKGETAVTPHPAELGRLLGITTEEVLADRLGAALRFNSLYETTIVAKGSPTFIVSCDKTYVSFTGNPGLSRGGSGDVLTGIIAGLAAIGLHVDEAAAIGAFIHGYAADRAADKLSQTGMLPSDVTAELPFVFNEMNR